MQLLENHDDLCSLKFSPWFVQSLIALYVLKEFSSRTLINHHLKFVLVLKSLVEFDDEGVLVLLHDLFLKVSMDLMPILFDKILSYRFHSIEFVVDVASN